MSQAYRQAGVDIDAGNEAVRRIRHHVKRTWRPEVVGDLGGFAGLFSLPQGFREPLLVAATDGIGTKLKIAFALDKHDTIGIDCVAMCVNDVVVQGAEPLFFLDYVATGKLKPEKIELIVKGIADGCAEAGCALIGGETAEMPGMYPEGEYDVAGFCVGIVERSKLLPKPSEVQAGDVLIGIASSGLHSNGFSLVRKIIEEQSISWDQLVPGMDQTFGEVLLTPTRIYVKPFMHLCQKVNVKGAAHITGGGLIENLPRVLPKGIQAVVDSSCWEIPPIFTWLVEHGSLSKDDAFRTFNMGIGMVAVVSNEEAEKALALLREQGETAFFIGELRTSQQEGVVVV